MKPPLECLNPDVTSQLGDVLWNNVRGDEVGWMCVEAGRPGVWASLGKFDPSTHTLTFKLPPEPEPELRAKHGRMIMRPEK